MKKLSLLTLALLSCSAVAEIHLSPLTTSLQGNISQLAVSEQDELFVINEKGELWKMGDNPQKLSDELSPKIAFNVAYNRIAAADKKGNFWLWSENQSYSSDIPLAQNAGMQPLAFATIAVSPQQGKNQLVRIEKQDNALKVTATAKMDILPDAHPIQIDFQNPQTNQGHIAVLAKPDNKTYQHGVLGDDLEALEVHYLERHTLEPLAEKLAIQGLVFEANRFEHFSDNNGSKLVSVMSGNGDGGRAVLIDLEKGKLTVKYQSSPLPSNRWQSPFVFNHKLYAVQMPHLRGRLVEYSPKGSLLQERFIQDGFSNHAYGEYETNLTAVTQDFALIPKRDYRQVAIIDKQGKLSELDTQLPSSIIKTRASKQRAYLLLNNGQIWVAENR